VLPVFCVAECKVICELLWKDVEVEHPIDYHCHFYAAEAELPYWRVLEYYFNENILFVLLHSDPFHEPQWDVQLLSL
jgi:hypothetical protein